MLNSNIKVIWAKYCKLWHDLSGWKLFAFYILHYTLLFIVLQHFVFSVFYKSGKTFIESGDGFCSYIPRMIYISQTLRDGIQNLLAGNGWTIPLYDFRLGPAKLDLQVEPIQWLAVLCPLDEIDALYDILVLIRYYLIGISFSTLGFYFKQKPLPVVIGAISYAFCGFSIYGGVRHPWYLGPMILLPLLIIGAEQLLKDQKGFLFTFIVFLSLVSSLYFSCMLAILIFIYLVIRYFCVYANNGLKGFNNMLGRAILWGGTGIFLSCIVTVPTLINMIGTGRIGRDVGDLLHYSVSVYEKFLTTFIITPNAIATWTYLGFAVLAVPAVILLFVENNKSKNIRSLQYLFVILSVMLCSPAITYMMSGFNAISGRWCFAYALCVSFVMTVELPKLQYGSKNVILFCIGGSLIYVLICYFVVNHKFYYEASTLLLLLSISLLGCCYFSGEKGKKIILPMCLGLTCISIGYSAFLLYDSEAKNLVSRFVNKDNVYDIYYATQYGSLGHSSIVQNDDDFFRISASNISRNDAPMSFYWDINGLSFYTSSVVEAYKEIQSDLEIMQCGTLNRGLGITGRAPILSLFNIKYYAVRGNAPVPYGFEEVDSVDKDRILENKYFLPIGYTYDSYMLEKQFVNLSPLEKQEAMLQAVVLENEPDNIFTSKKNVEILSQKMPVEILDMQNVIWQDGVLKVSEEKATMTLGFVGIPNYDTYLRVVNLDLTSGNSARNWNLTVNIDKNSTYARFCADGWLYSNGAKTQLLYLGNSSEGYTTCTLTFPQKGTFILDDLEIWCQPMDNYAEQIEALRAEPLENIETNWRGLTGTVDLSKDKIMCFGIPYETGWSVYVDGEKRELMQANIGLMAVELEAGYHDIELKYWLPGLTAGIIMSLVGVMLLCGIVVYSRRNKIKKRAN